MGLGQNLFCIWIGVWTSRTTRVLNHSQNPREKWAGIGWSISKKNWCALPEEMGINIWGTIWLWLETKYAAYILDKNVDFDLDMYIVVQNLVLLSSTFMFGNYLPKISPIYSGIPKQQPSHHCLFLSFPGHSLLPPGPPSRAATSGRSFRASLRTQS